MWLPLDHRVGDPGVVRGGRAEQKAGPVRALEIAVGIVLPGDADGTVELDHLAGDRLERFRAVGAGRGG